MKNKAANSNHLKRYKPPERISENGMDKAAKAREMVAVALNPIIITLFLGKLKGSFTSIFLMIHVSSRKGMSKSVAIMAISCAPCCEMGRRANWPRGTKSRRSQMPRIGFFKNSTKVANAIAAMRIRRGWMNGIRKHRTHTVAMKSGVFQLLAIVSIVFGIGC